MIPKSGKQEWAALWPLPFTAMLGIAGASMFAYSSGIFMASMTRELGWSRVEFSSAFSIMMLVGLVAMPFAGWLADRHGARRIALIGIIPFALAFSLFGLIRGALWQYWALALLTALCSAAIAPPMWITTVVENFKRSRGLALAVALAGIGLASTVWPLLSAVYIDRIGWRLTFPVIAFTWAVPMFVITYFFFRAPGRAAPATRHRRDGTQSPSRAGFRKALMSRTFLCLMIAGSLFSCCSYAISVHIVPLLAQRGFGLAAAAGIAGTAGLFSIIGRIGIGFLLDHVPTRVISLIVFLVPILVSALLWQSDRGMAFAVVAAALFGISNGAETDIIAYVAARQFPRAMFASLYASVTAVVAVSASLGPLLAGAIYDATKSYDMFLLVVIPMALVATFFAVLIPAGNSEVTTEDAEAAVIA
ncbi:MAG TPA: MFS transporter [Sphingobium sp.]|uniref:MFS transporter n=1 Tax=Sphingobium sp. TaxID=1912891 RepID=UPI002ED590F0